MLFHGALFELPLFGTQESGDVVVVDVGASDSISVTLTVNLSELLSGVDVSDPLPALLSDAVEHVFGEVSAADTAYVELDDAPSIFGDVSVNDQTIVYLDGALDLFVIANVADSAAVKIVSIPAIDAECAVSDEIELSVGDESSGLFVLVDRSDAISLLIAEFLSRTVRDKPVSVLTNIGAGSASTRIRSRRVMVH